MFRKVSCSPKTQPWSQHTETVRVIAPSSHPALPSHIYPPFFFFIQGLFETLSSAANNFAFQSSNWKHVFCNISNWSFSKEHVVISILFLKCCHFLHLRYIVLSMFYFPDFFFFFCIYCLMSLFKDKLFEILF